jgi:hypothetical protein
MNNCHIRVAQNLSENKVLVEERFNFTHKVEAAD